IIALESGENFISSEDFIIDTEVDGVVRFLIPTDFMRVATNVIGQVYVGTLDGDEVLVERQFKFAVSQDLLSNIPVEEKVRYIKTFDDLRIEIGDRLGSIEETLLSLENFIEEIEYTTKQGVDEITNLFNSQTIAFNTNYDEKFNTINTIKTDIETYVDAAQADMVAKKAEFDEAVAGSGLVTEASATNWQKHKLTDDSGVLPAVPLDGDLAALQALPSGFYYRTSVPITGMGQTSAAGFVTVWEANGGLVKNISFKPYNSNQEFIMRYYNEWSSWENKFDGLEKSIDAQEKANKAENNSKLYTDEKIKEQHKVLINGSTSKLG